MVSEIESYLIYSSYVSSSWNDEAARALQRFLKSRSSFMRRKLAGYGEEAVNDLASVIFQMSQEPSASKLSYVSTDKTLGQILKRAISRLKQTEARYKQKEQGIKFEAVELDELEAIETSEPNLYPIQKVEEFTCSVKEFARIIGMRYQEVRRMIREGQVISSKGRIRALAALKALGMATPILDRSAGF